MFYEGINSFADSSRTLEFRDRLEQWAADHPVTSLHFNRASIIPALSSLVTPEEKTAVTALGAIAQNLDDLTLRLNLYAAQTPTEARWQAEYMLLDMDARGRLDSIETQANRLLSSLELLTGTLASGNFTMDILSLRSFHDDVQALTSLVHAEHEAIFIDIDRQRLASLILLDSLARRSVREAGSEAQTTVDHLALRLGQLSAALVIAIALVIVGWYLGRRYSGRRA
jgi:predicted PurR-regulated permease PerM